MFSATVFFPINTYLYLFVQLVIFFSPVAMSHILFLLKLNRSLKAKVINLIMDIGSDLALKDT